MIRMQLISHLTWVVGLSKCAVSLVVMKHTNILDQRELKILSRKSTLLVLNSTCRICTVFLLVELIKIVLKSKRKYHNAIGNSHNI